MAIDTGMQLLEKMFAVEMAFMKSDKKDKTVLAEAFHESVTVHEPSSLPYAGDWKGLNGVAALFGRMAEIWSHIGIENMQAAQSGNIVFMSCRLTLVSRANEITIEQPFSEVLHFQEGRLLKGTPFYFDTAEIVSALRSGITV
jgi:ketosteroid isomerase-like protein